MLGAAADEPAAIAAEHGAAAATRMQQAMHDNVDDVVAFADAHGIGDACHRGGTISLARTQPQVERLRRPRRRDGSGSGSATTYAWLDADEAPPCVPPPTCSAASDTPHCATVHPLRLTHAVARAAVAAGARIHEHTTVDAIEPRRFVTDRGDVRADVVVRATEGYTDAVRRPAPRAAADLLADDRHRTARPTTCGTRSVSPTARRSTTGAT